MGNRIIRPFFTLPQQIVFNAFAKAASNPQKRLVNRIFGAAQLKSQRA